MAPALTSEAAARAREELQSQPPSVSNPLITGREGTQRDSTAVTRCKEGQIGDNLSTQGHLISKNSVSQLTSLATDIIQKSLLDPNLGIHCASLKQIGSSKDIEELYLKHKLLFSSSKMATQRDNALSSLPTGKNGLSLNVEKKEGGNSSHTIASTDTQIMEIAHDTVNGINKMPQLLKPDLHVDNIVSCLEPTLGEDVVQMDESKPGPSNVSPTAPVQVVYNETSLTDINSRHFRLSKRVQFLLRRLRRLQSKQTISHVKQQLSGLVELLQKTLPNYKRLDSRNEFMLNRDVKNLSTATLVNLIHSWQAKEAQAQHSQKEKVSRTKLKEELCLEMDRVASQLSSNLRHLETAVDSDATESSSGGESCEEEMDFDCEWDGKVRHMPVRKRFEYKWAKDRALIASKWTWLQAQVSDLEYRIRQQNDIFNQIKESKGIVTLAEPPSLVDTINRVQRQESALGSVDKLLQVKGKNQPSPSDITKLMHNVDKQSCNLSKQLGNVYSPLSQGSSTLLDNCQTVSPNGLVDPSSQHLKTPDISVDRYAEKPSPEIDTTCQAARCRAVKSYRKRKLLRTKGLHQINRKAARLSTVRCHCYPPLTTCAVCSGRFNNVMAVDPDIMSLPERVSVIDPSFHPVLSFTEDIPLSSRFESLLKSAEWLELHSSNFSKKNTVPRTRKSIQRSCLQVHQLLCYHE